MAESKTDKWIAALKPVFGGLVTLMAAAALWLNHSSGQTCEIQYANIDKRVTLMESQVTDLQSNQTSLSGKIDKILDAVSDIRVDIAKMAASADNTRNQR